MGLDKIPHHLNTFRILKYNALHSVGSKKFFSAFEIMVFADDHSGNFVEQACSRTHDARAQSAYQDEFVPIGPPSSVANANHFCVRRRIASLDTQIMASGNNL